MTPNKTPDLNESEENYDSENNAPGARANSYQRRKPRNMLVLLVVILVFAFIAIGGIIYAVTGTHKDPSAIQLPSHTTKSLAEEQPPVSQPDASAPVTNESAAASPQSATTDPVQTQDDDDDFEQQEAPLQMTPQPEAKPTLPVPEPEQEKVLTPAREDVAPQSMIIWDTMPSFAQNEHGTTKIAIIIDDMGLNQRNSREVASMSGVLTLAYLPYAEHLPQQTASAYAHGHELIVHMPMEPEDITHNNPGPNALLTTLSAEEVARRTQYNLSRFDGYVGLNNHMGSKFTTNEALLRPVMQIIKDKGLWFLDSKTSEGSKAASLATQLGIPYAVRDVFLDNVQTVQAVLTQLRQTEAIARKRGYAIAIGHPHTATIEALKIWLPQAEQKGIQLVSLSSIIAQRFPHATVPRYARIEKGEAVLTGKLQSKTASENGKRS